MAKTTTKPVAITTDMVDELASVRDQLKALTAREKYLKEIFLLHSLKMLTLLNLATLLKIILLGSTRNVPKQE